MRTLIGVVGFLTLSILSLWGQALSTSSLTGKYFVRHVEFTTDSGNQTTDARSIIGTITFDGTGGYTLSGQQVIGIGNPAAFSVTGTYGVSPSGLTTLTNPQKTTLTISGRFGVEALIGSSTEATDNTFDLFVAIPAPPATAKYSNATLSTGWDVVDLELTNAAPGLVRNAGMGLVFDGVGNIPNVNMLAHGASINGGLSQRTTSYLGTYSLSADGTGTISFIPPASIAPASVFVSSSSRVMAVSASGHMLIAGSAGAHDIVIGIRAAPADNISTASFSGRYWLSGIEVDSNGSSSYAGAATVLPANNAIIIAERLHQSSSPNRVYATNGGNFGIVNPGTGTGAILGVDSTRLYPGAGKTLLAASLGSDSNGNPKNQSKFSIGVGEMIPDLSGSGVFVNPQGVVNAASNAPVGNPISPGEFIAIYGSGLAAQTVVAAPPYPTSLGGVSLTIGGLPAPLYLVSAGQINCLVPYGVNTSTGSTTLVVNNNGALSNMVTSAVSATSPGIFSDDLSGIGDGAIVHLNNTLVNSKSPAAAGETLVIYLTGLGLLQSAIPDGYAPNPAAADSSVATVAVVVDGILSPNVLYAGINPVFPGLYQINFQVPAVPDHGEVQVAISTPDAQHQQITLFVQ